jgi:hypothetical protein
MENAQEIQKLLDRYWEGETNIEEERRLRQYFNAPEVDERFQKFAPLFRLLEQEKSIEFHKTAALLPVQHQQRFSLQRFAAAASVALLLSAGLWVMYKPSKTQESDSIANLPSPAAVVPMSTVPAADIHITSMENGLSVLNVKTGSIKRKKRVLAAAYAPNANPTEATITDKEMEVAVLEVKAALSLLSSKLSKGRGEANKGTIHLDQIDRIFKKKNNAQSQG